MGRCRQLASLSIAALLLSVAPPARAFPLLRLFLSGDVETLGNGGGDAFRDPGREALRLERPALLGGLETGRVSLSLENEETVSIRTAAWDGTRASDRQLRLTAVAPAGELLPGVYLTFLAAIRREDGTTNLKSRRAGTILRIEEARNLANVGMATALPLGISLGATLESGPAGVPGLVAEARYQPTPLVTVWALRRSATYQYRLEAPPQVVTRLTSPDLLYEINDVQRETELGAEVGDRKRVWLRGGAEIAAPFDSWVEAGGKPLSWLGLQAGFDRQLFLFDDYMRADGSGAIAAVDLGLRRTRTFGGADLTLAPGELLLLRYVYGTIESASQANEVGTAATRAFLSVDVDLGLLLQTGHRLESHQLSLGWQRRVSERLGFSLGAQALRLVSFPGSASLTSDILELTLLSEELQPATIDLLGATASIRYEVGPFTISAAVAQLIPISVSTPAPDVPAGPQPPPPAPAPPREPPASPGPAAAYAALARAINAGFENYGGGNLVLLQMATKF